MLFLVSQVPLFRSITRIASRQLFEGGAAFKCSKVLLGYLQEYLDYKKTPPPLGPYRRPMPRVLWWSKGVGCLLMGEVPL